jgi:hypothetical protein
MPIVFKNNAATTIANQVLLSDTTVVVAAGTGSRFPAPSGGDSFFATIQSGTNYEIVEVTNRSGDVLTVVRGRDGTLSQLWNPGSSIDIRIPNIVLNRFVQMDASGNVNVSGNVGIGTAPGTLGITARLELITPNGTASRLLLGQSGVSNYSWMIPASTDALALVYGSAAERMRIDASGNVGIGTSAPTAKLEVANGAIALRSAVPEVVWYETDTSTTFRTLVDAGSWDVRRNDYTNLFSVYYLTGNTLLCPIAGNVGIGTSAPATKLHVLGGDGSSIVRIAGPSYATRFVSAPGAGSYIESTSPNGSTYEPLILGGSTLIFTTFGMEKARISGTGNWGFGLTNPGYPVTIAANGTSAALRLVGRPTDNISTLEFSKNDQSDACAFIQAGTDYLQFGPGTTPRFYLGSDGSRLSKSQGVTDWLPEFMCRAVANFSGVPLAGTYSRTDTTITVTMTAHGMTTGQRVELDFTTGAGTDGSYIVTVVNANTFTVTDTASGATSGNVTRLTWLRHGGNIARIEKVSTGRYRLTFSTAMPTRTYVVNPSASADNVAMNAVVPMVWGDTRLTTSFEVGISDNNTDTGPFDYPQIDISVFR